MHGSPVHRSARRPDVLQVCSQAGRDALTCCGWLSLTRDAYDVARWMSRVRARHVNTAQCDAT
jgi:hypothetical protein